MEHWIKQVIARLAQGDTDASCNEIAGAATEAHLLALEHRLREDGWNARLDLSSVREAIRARRSVLALRAMSGRAGP